MVYIIKPPTGINPKNEYFVCLLFGAEQVAYSGYLELLYAKISCKLENATMIWALRVSLHL